MVCTVRNFAIIQPMRMQDIIELEADLEDLRVAYERYFLGLDKREPEADFKRLQRAVIMASEAHIPNTATRFRAQQLKARFVTLSNYWTRTKREIEDGTYHRHRFMAKLHEAEAAAKQAHAALTSSSHAEPTPAEASSFEDVVDLYRRLQQRSGEKPIAADKLLATLAKQEASLKQKYNAKRIEFRVVLEDGKPKIKAKPLRD